MKKMKLIIDREQYYNARGGYKIYEYTPTIYKEFYCNYEKQTFQRWVRFLFELIKGYKVYYLSIDKNIIGYCVISRGGGRYSFAKKEDIVVGPYFVIEKYRGNKYSEILVNELLRYNGIKYCAAYDWVRQTNIPSIKCAQRCGFEVECTADIVKPFRTFRLRKDDLGEYFIFRKTNKVL